MVEKQIIDYLLSNSGKLKGGETWYDVAIKFGISVPNKDRISEEGYIQKALSKKANDIWRKYLKQKNKLKLSKEIYENGKLKWETFRDKPEDVQINHEDFDIEKVTTNPYGGAWFKLKKKEKFYEEEHLEKLKEILTKEIEPQSYNTKSNSSEKKALFIYGSDKHIGALTKENSIYSNKYDKEEIKKRIVDCTLSEIENWIVKYGILDSLFIMDLGDALDGYNQKTTGGLRGTSSHTLPQQLNNREQHDLYVELHKELFDILTFNGYAENLYFIATSNSNHGGDFEYGAMRNLETYLNVKYPFIKTYVSYYPYNHFFYGEHCIIFGHGKDDEDMKNGLPLVLNDKVENYIEDYIRVNELQSHTVTFVTGDLHQSAETYGKNIRYKKVLSQYGSSKWMHTNFGSGAAGLSSELLFKDSNKILKTDTFFEIKDKSNTGIKL